MRLPPCTSQRRFPRSLPLDLQLHLSLRRHSADCHSGGVKAAFGSLSCTASIRQQLSSAANERLLRVSAALHKKRAAACVEKKRFGPGAGSLCWSRIPSCAVLCPCAHVFLCPCVCLPVLLSRNAARPKPCLFFPPFPPEGDRISRFGAEQDSSRLVPEKKKRPRKVEKEARRSRVCDLI